MANHVCRRANGTTRLASLIAGIALSGSLLAVDAPARAVSGPPVAPGVDGRELVVWGGASVRLGTRTSVATSGDPGVVLAEATARRRDGRLRLGTRADVTSEITLVGDHVRIGNRATAGGDVYHGSLSNRGTIGGSTFSPIVTPVPIADAPVFRTGAPSSTDVTVRPNRTRALPPGEHGHVRVRRGATLVLDGAGDYVLRSLRLEPDAAVEVDADDDVEIMIAERVRTSPRVSFGPAPGAAVGASDVVVYVDGARSSRSPAVIVGARSRFEATLYANTERANVLVGSHASITGAVFGHHVAVGARTEIVGDSFFAVTESDLSVSKVDDVDPVVSGEALTYTVEVANAGPDDAPNVIVTDTLPAGVTFVSSSGCGEDPNGVPTCALGTIPAGGSASYTVEVVVDAGTLGTITNEATVTSDSVDPVPGNDTATEDTTVVPPEADLSVRKVDDVDPVVAGDTVTYTVEVSNAGPQAAQDVVAVDTLPAGVTFVSSSGCGEDPNGVPSCALGTIPAGGSASYTVEVVVDAGTLGTITNQVSVSSSTDDPDPANDTAAEDTTVTPPPSPPTAADDGPTASSSPGDDHHAFLNTTLTVVDGSSADLLLDDDLGVPEATIVSFGGGSLGGAVTDHAAGSTVPVGAGSLTVGANGAYVFTPDTDVTGPFTFEYRLDNGVGTSDATVTIAVGERLAAVDDARGSIGNVGIDTSSGTPFSVLDNDGGDRAVVTSIDTTSANGGTVTDLGDGRFTYDPPAGFTGSDTFGYTITNGFGTDGATVTVTVTDTIWFVDHGAAAPGDGTLAAPFDTLAAFVAGATDAPGDAIHLAESGAGDYLGGITLLDGQVLIGDGSSATIDDVAGITLPPNSRALPATGGDHPTVAEGTPASAVTLAADNTIRGLDVANTGGGSGIVGTSVGTLSISEIERLGSTGGRALDLNGGTWSVDVDAVDVASSATGGVSLVGGGSSTATFGTLTLATTGGTALAASNAGTVDVTDPASTITSSGGRAVDLAATGGDMTFGSVAATSPTTSGLVLDGTTGTFAVTGTTSVTGRGGTGIVLSDVAGTVSFGATTVDNTAAATGDGIRIVGSSAAFTFASVDIADTVVGTPGTFDGLGRPTNDGDGNGIFVQDLSGSLAVDGGSITDFADNAVDIRSSRDVTLSGMTIDADFSGNSAVQGDDVLDVTLTDTTIRDLDNVDVAPGVRDNGLRFTDLEGTVNVSGVSIRDVEGYVQENGTTGSDNRAIEVQNRQGCTVQDGTGDCDLDVNVDGLVVERFDFQGISIRQVGGTTDVAVAASDFRLVNGAAISTGPDQAATHAHTVDLTGNTFTDVGIAAELFSSRGGDTTASVTGNTITRTHGDGIRLVAFNQAGAGPAATFLGTVSDNTMTGIAANDIPSASGGTGLFVAAEDGVTAKVLADGNSITGHTDTGGLVAECIRTQNQRDGDLDLVVRNSSCTDFPTNFFGAVFIGNDNDTTAPFTNTCVDFAATNSYTNTNGLFANTFATDSTGSSVLDLPNGFNSALPALDFGNPPTSGPCSIAPLS